jgi:exopolyphosphatase / guanosine-5'-triphosphate,3'-diphosphate pyrophosphatase
MTLGANAAGRTTQPAIVPRWEWRAFGDRFGRADDLLAAHTVLSVLDSDELYLVSAKSDASVKVRGGLMDVKHLQRVNDDGLELWMPVMKASFPLSVEDTASVLTTLNVVAPPLERGAYTLDAIETELVQPNPELLCVRVHKRRSRYLVDECMVELTEVRAGSTTTHTLALESPEPALVSATVRKFRLEGRRNVSVAPGLKTIVGFGARRYGVIDVGTNSVKFHLCERRADGEVGALDDRAEITRLGEGLDDSGQLAEEPIRRTVEAIADMVDEARRHDAVAVTAVGTAGLRLAPNRAELVDAVQARCGVTVEVISGEEEARLAYLAALSALPAARGRLVVFDSGGGSTQFTFGQDERVDEQFSVGVGAVRVAERYGLASAVSTDILDAALAAVAGDLDRLGGQPTPDAVVAIGGTATNLAAVKHGLAHYDADVVQGSVLDLDEIDRQIELYRTRDADQRRQIVGLQPARAEVILAGACIVRTILTKLDHTSLTVSDRGLRHGVVFARFAR